MAKGGKRKGGSWDKNHQGDSKKSKYFAQGASTIPVGSRGFLISCDNGKEVLAARDAINLFTEYYEKLAPDHKDGDERQTGKSIDALIADEVADLKDISQKLFTFCKLGVSGLIFIKMEAREGPGPVQLVVALLQDIKQFRSNKSRLLIRYVPVEVVCPANLDSIKATAAKLLAPVFAQEEDAEPVQFAVQFEHRASVKLGRMDVINAVIAGIKQPPHKVNLTSPRKTIMVEIIKSYCLMSCVEHYKDLAKYNARILVAPDAGRTPLASKKIEEPGSKEEEPDAEEKTDAQAVGAGSDVDDGEAQNGAAENEKGTVKSEERKDPNAVEIQKQEEPSAVEVQENDEPNVVRAN